MMKADPFKFVEHTAVPKRKSRLKFYSKASIKQARCILHIETRSTAEPAQKQMQVKEVSVASVIERHMAFLRVKYPFLLPSQIKGHALTALGLPNCMGELSKSIPVKGKAKKTSWIVPKLLVNPLAMVNFSLLLRNFVQKLAITEHQTSKVVMNQSNASTTQSQSPKNQQQQAKSAETNSDFHISECSSDGDIFQDESAHLPKKLVTSAKSILKKHKMKPVAVKVKRTSFTKTEVTFSSAPRKSTTTCQDRLPDSKQLTDNTSKSNKSKPTLPKFVEKDTCVTQTYSVTIQNEISFEVPECFSSQETEDYEVGLFKSPKRSCFNEQDDSEMEKSATDSDTSTEFDVPLRQHEKHQNKEENLRLNTPVVPGLVPFISLKKADKKTGHESLPNSPVSPQVSVSRESLHDVLNNSQSSEGSVLACNESERNINNFSPAVAELETSRDSSDNESNCISLAELADQDELDSILSDHEVNTATDKNSSHTTQKLTRGLLNETFTMGSDRDTPSPVKQTSNILGALEVESNDTKENSNSKPEQSSEINPKFRAQEKQIIGESQDVPDYFTMDSDPADSPSPVRQTSKVWGALEDEESNDTQENANEINSKFRAPEKQITGESQDVPDYFTMDSDPADSPSPVRKTSKVWGALEDEESNDTQENPNEINSKFRAQVEQVIEESQDVPDYFTMDSDPADSPSPVSDVLEASEDESNDAQENSNSNQEQSSEVNKKFRTQEKQIIVKSQDLPVDFPIDSDSANSPSPVKQTANILNDSGDEENNDMQENSNSNQEQFLQISLKLRAQVEQIIEKSQDLPDDFPIDSDPANSPSPVKQTANVLEDSEDEESNESHENSNSNQEQFSQTNSKLRAQEKQIIEKSLDLPDDFPIDSDSTNSPKQTANVLKDSEDEESNESQENYNSNQEQSPEINSKFKTQEIQSIDESQDLSDNFNVDSDPENSPSPVKQSANVLNYSADEESNDTQEKSHTNQEQVSEMNTKFRIQEKQIIEELQDLPDNFNMDSDRDTPSPVKQTSTVLGDSEDEGRNDTQEKSHTNQKHSSEIIPFRAQEKQTIEKLQDFVDGDPSDEEQKENSAASPHNIIENEFLEDDDDIFSSDGQEKQDDNLSTPKQNQNKIAKRYKVSDSKILLPPKVETTKLSKNLEDNTIQTEKQPKKAKSITQDVAEANNEMTFTKTKHKSSDGKLKSLVYSKVFNKKKVSEGKLCLPSSPRAPLLEVTKDSPDSANRMQTRCSVFKMPVTPGGSSDGVIYGVRKLKSRKCTPRTVDVVPKRKLFDEIDKKKRASKQQSKVSGNENKSSPDDPDNDSDLSDVDSIWSPARTPAKKRNTQSSTPKPDFDLSKFSPSLSDIDSEVDMDVIQSNLSDITEMGNTSKISADSFIVSGKFSQFKATPVSKSLKRTNEESLSYCEESDSEQEDKLSTVEQVKHADDTASQATEDSALQFCRSKVTTKRSRRILNLPGVDAATKVSSYLSGLGESSSQESYLSNEKSYANNQKNMKHLQESRKSYVPSECSVASFLVNLYDKMSDEEDAPASIATNAMDEELSED